MPRSFPGWSPRKSATRSSTLLLDFLGAGFSRVILFVHTRGELRGHRARGRDLLVDAIKEIRIPSASPSIFGDALSLGAPYFSRMPEDTEIDRRFAAALGGCPGNVLVLPIKLGSIVPLLIFAQGLSRPVDPRSIAELTQGVSAALQRIIARRRSTMPPM